MFGCDFIADEIDEDIKDGNQVDETKDIQKSKINQY